MLYAIYTRGFKAGGFNALVPVGLPQNIQFGPEYVDSYEVGIKSELLDGTVHVNCDAFRSNYTDLEENVLVFDQTTGADSSQIRNVAKSRSHGLELEAQWVISHQFRLSTNVTYLDSRYLDYPNADASTLQRFCAGGAANYANPQCSVFPNPVPPRQDLSGQPTPCAPTWSGAVRGTYSTTISDCLFTLRLSPSITSNYLTVPGDAAYKVPGYMRLDGSVWLGSPNGHWVFDIIGKILTDRIIISIPSQYGKFGLSAKEKPLNVAVQFRYKW